MSSGPGATYVVFEQRYGSEVRKTVSQITLGLMEITGKKYRECWFLAREMWLSQCCQLK